MRLGFTLYELTLVLVVLGTLAGLTIPRARRVLDQVATDRAVSEVLLFYHRARLTALWRATPVEIEFRSDSLRATLRGVTDSLFLIVPGPARHGVAMRASRSTISVYANGLGWGAANTKLVLQRGTAAESLTTSRLGRLKRW